MRKGSQIVGPLRQRRKRPFYTPIKSWFFGDDRPDYVREVLSESALRDAGLFNPATVARLEAQLEGAPDHHLRRMQLEWILVLILGTQLLHELFVSQFQVDPKWETPLPAIEERNR